VYAKNFVTGFVEIEIEASLYHTGHVYIVSSNGGLRPFPGFLVICITGLVICVHTHLKHVLLIISGYRGISIWVLLLYSL